MDNKKSFFICGGDMRQVFLAKLLQEDGNNVVCYGFDNTDPFAKQCDSVKDAAQQADIVILPLPAVTDGCITMPLSDKRISVDEFVRSMCKHQLIMAGMAGEPLIRGCKEHSLLVMDYFEREELAVMNAIPTAEGAIQIAMEETPYTIQGSRCLVTGYGRIGKLLACKLNALGAEVSAAARKQKDLAWISADRCKPIRLNNLSEHIGNFDIIFNTVPHLILDSEILKKVNNKSIIIDLASRPGGVDFELAGELGLNVIWALSLPGKIAPYTSAVIIKDTITNMISELEV